METKTREEKKKITIEVFKRSWNNEKMAFSAVMVKLFIYTN